MFKCKLCGVTGDLAVFYKGVPSRCRECHKKMIKLNREEKAEYYRQYDALRFKNDPRVKERHKRYHATEAGKSSLQASKRKWISNNPEKRAAHVILGNRLRDGSVQKPKECSVCGKSGVRIHGHHHDYSKPLEVKWVCSPCHWKEHNP